MRSSRVPAPGVIVLPADALERRSLVDGHARASVLVLVIRIRGVNGGTERREAVWLAGPSQRRRFGLRGREVVGGRLFQRALRCHRRRVRTKEVIGGQEWRDELICWREDTMRTSDQLVVFRRQERGRAIHIIPASRASLGATIAPCIASTARERWPLYVSGRRQVSQTKQRQLTWTGR